jgi:outer membrane protein assembly factor BamC
MAYSFAANKTKTVAAALASIIGLSACSTIGSFAEANKVDYKSASKTITAKLDVPPDLTQIRRDNRFAIPEVSQGALVASGSSVALTGLKDVRIERSGNQRWLVVKQTPELLWPTVKEFWTDLGFTLVTENPEAGVLETDWAENRANLPKGWIREAIGKVFDSAYSTGERDKFRTRIERGADGVVEIHISHRGLLEVYTGKENETTSWTARPSDASLEAEMLSRLMVKLGAGRDTAKAAVASAAPTQLERAKLMSSGGLNYIQMDEGFDRSWRRLGLALDRAGFTVEDRDRSKGIYFVRYIDEDIDAKKKGSGGNFFTRLFTTSKSEQEIADSQRYRILVKEIDGVSGISIRDKEGKVDVSPVTDKILKVLQEQLK